MKTSLTKLKSSILLSCFFLASSVWAKPVAQVVEVKGQVFAVGLDGSTKTLKLNDHLEDQSEIMVGEDAQLTLNDYYDATYHLIQGSHLKFFNKSVQLKKGKAWIQSLNARHPLSLTTANGHVAFWKGEFITTFEQTTAKTQVLVVNGEVEVSNILDKNMKYSLAAGTFTMVDPEVENGLPRAPTKVGLNSLHTALSEFKTLPQKLQTLEPEVAPAIPATARSIASVPEVSPAPEEPKKGEILFMSNGKMMSRNPASSIGAAHQYLKKKTSKITKTKLTNAPISFYGFVPALSEVNASNPETVREPASIERKLQLEMPKKIASDVSLDQEFAETLRLNQDSQPKHTKELENLIHDLKSY
jgi:hypothetical protein